MIFTFDKKIIGLRIRSVEKLNQKCRLVVYEQIIRETESIKFKSMVFELEHICLICQFSASVL